MSCDVTGGMKVAGLVLECGGLGKWHCGRVGDWSVAGWEWLKVKRKALASIASVISGSGSFGRRGRRC